MQPRHEQGELSYRTICVSNSPARNPAMSEGKPLLHNCLAILGESHGMTEARTDDAVVGLRALERRLQHNTKVQMKSLLRK